MVEFILCSIYVIGVAAGLVWLAHLPPLARREELLAVVFLWPIVAVVGAFCWVRSFFD